MRWFANDGGPMIILPREALAFWEGGNEPRDGRVIQISTPPIMGGSVATDYDRACNAKDGAELLSVGSSWGLAITETTEGASAWLDIFDPEIRVAVCVAASDDKTNEQYCNRYDKVPAHEWRMNAESVPIKCTELILMHAASSTEVNEDITPGTNYAVIGDALVEKVPFDFVRIDSCEINLPDATLFSFHRFRKV